MNRALKLAAILVFLAVLIILLTPADDGPVMSLRGGQVIAFVFVGLMVVAGGMRMDLFVLRLSSCSVTTCCRDLAGQQYTACCSLPLLC